MLIGVNGQVEFLYTHKREKKGNHVIIACFFGVLLTLLVEIMSGKSEVEHLDVASHRILFTVAAARVKVGQISIFYIA